MNINFAKVTLYSNSVGKRTEKRLLYYKQGFKNCSFYLTSSPKVDFISSVLWYNKLSKLPRYFGFFSEVSLSKLKHVGQGDTKAVTNYNIILASTKRKNEDSCLQILSSPFPSCISRAFHE